MLASMFASCFQIPPWNITMGKRKNVKANGIMQEKKWYCILSFQFIGITLISYKNKLHFNQFSSHTHIHTHPTFLWLLNDSFGWKTWLHQYSNQAFCFECSRTYYVYKFIVIGIEIYMAILKLCTSTDWYSNGEININNSKNK